MRSLSSVALASAMLTVVAGKKPNIVIYMTEDMSPRTGFFGDAVASTPNLDAFAKTAVTLTNLFSVYAVCAPSRSSFITDSFATAVNGTPYLTVPTPDIKAFPELLRQSGYWSFSGPKADLQFSDYKCSSAPQGMWSSCGGDDKSFWRNMPAGDSRPFMGQLGDQTTHESKIFPNSPIPDILNRTEMIERVSVPDFYLDTKAMRNDIASQYNNIAVMDGHFGKLMANLKQDTLMDDTIVIWMSDHGDGLPRGKRDLFDYGIHVPCIIWLPEKLRPTWWPAAGEQLDRMVSFLDFAPSLLDLAGVELSKTLHGKSIFGNDTRGDYVFGAKDRMDEAYDRVRYVRSKDGFKLIRNYMPELPAGGRVSYRYQQLGATELRDAFHAGELNKVQSRWFEPRPDEEFYDINSDPQELNNLVNTADADKTKILKQLRAELDKELARVPDLGAIPEEELAQKFWPNGVQPVTPEPKVDIDEANSELQLAANAEGSSLLYKLTGCGQDDEWFVYGAPVALNKCKALKAKAQRYGWKESSTVSQNIGAFIV